MHLPPLPSRLVLLFVCIVASPAGITARQATTAPKSDLDAFMEKVLARREVNRKMLNQYVLDETETFEILGPGRWPLHRTKRDFTWYERDGTHVRSPVRFNGVPVNEAERRQYENDWLKREKGRQEREAKKAQDKKNKENGEISIGPGGVEISTGGVPTEPRFVSEAYFMDFKFEPGNYYLAGREKLEGQDVLRIEYYPTNLFNDEDDEKTPREMKGKKRTEEQKEKGIERDINRKMNKTAMVTLWVDPAEHQIVKYTFDNVWLDFLPAAWLVRIDDLRASMTMGQPFPGVWLPRNINIHAGLTLALGSFEAAYGREFRDYREAQVKTTIKVPKLSSRQVPQQIVPLAAPPDAAAVEDHGPFVGEDRQQPGGETIREIRVHGNAAVSDEDVLKLAGLAVGDPVTPESLKLAEKRLKDSDRFETIDIRKRYRSIDDPTDVAIVLIVHERPGVTSAPGGGGITRGSRPWHRAIGDRLMFFPILTYEDGYGFTYGARFSTVDLLGLGERLSTPLTWGGTRRAALEFERTFTSGPLTRVFSSFGVWNRENPHYELGDTRVEWKGRAERQIAHMVRLGVDATRSSVSFGDLDDQIWTFGTNAVLDTRADPAFPGNAVVLGAGWSQLNVRGRDPINRYTTDTRGYLRVVRQAVVAGRFQYFTSDAALPPYEHLLMGGSSNLRGFRTGTFAGDRMIVTSAELRIPISSVIHSAKFGVEVFTDASKIADFGARLKDAEWRRGAGAGVFIIAPLVKINLDVAHGLDGGGTRFSLGTGFSF